MSVQTFIILLLAGLTIACSQTKKDKLEKMEIIKGTFYHIEDDVFPPPPDLTSNSETVQEWLFSICNDEKLQKPIAIYRLGLFESPDQNTIYLVGTNNYEDGDTSYTRIEFEPSNIYFQLPPSEYKSLDRDQLLNKLTDQLKAFTETEKFKTSFLSKANAIIFEPNGQTVWAK
jgi:hypothetical protein